MNRKERRAARKRNDPATAPPARLGGQPNVVEVLLRRGRELLAAGDDEAAIGIASRLVRMEENPDTKAFFVGCVTGYSYFPGADEMQGILARAMREAWTWPSELMAPVLGILERDPLIGPALSRASQRWPQRLSARELLGAQGLAAVARQPLLLALLETIHIPDRRFERFLTMLRGAMLAFATSTAEIVGDDIVGLAGALAQQCFINEYVFDVATDEQLRIDALRDAICANFSRGAPVPPLWVAATAAYVRLDTLPARALWDRAWPPAVARLVDQQVREGEALQRIRVSIPRLTSINDALSLAVQNQYEENPYPRWISSPAAIVPVPIEADLRREFPHQAIPDRRADPRLDILVAGCGTGQQPMYFARRYKDAKVLAVDLALSSLAYAQAKSRAAGLTNIEFGQADILEMAHIGRTFDLVVATGVLHHLADPLAGWRTLASLLRPDGFMYIGLYSEMARRDIVAAQQWLAAHGYTSTPDDIRRARQELMRIDDPAWKTVFAMADFYATSECRDLLFHVHERRFTLPRIAAFLDENELKFLGLTAGSAVARRFRSRFPDGAAMSDLAFWHAFEAENPDTFINMYRFWVRKAAQT